MSLFKNISRTKSRDSANINDFFSSKSEVANRAAYRVANHNIALQPYRRFTTKQRGIAICGAAFIVATRIANRKHGNHKLLHYSHQIN